MARDVSISKLGNHMIQIYFFFVYVKFIIKLCSFELDFGWLQNSPVAEVCGILIKVGDIHVKLMSHAVTFS